MISASLSPDCPAKIKQQYHHRCHQNTDRTHPEHWLICAFPLAISVIIHQEPHKHKRNCKNSHCCYNFLFPVKTGYPDQQKDQLQNQADFKKDHQKILHCHTAFRKISHLPPLFLNTIHPINHSFSSSCCTFNSGLSDINPRRSASATI